MKRKFMLAVSGILVIGIVILFGLHFWVGTSVKRNIHLAMERYPGTAEDALISFLLDENNPFAERTHVAVWTLGQIRSEKARPVLIELYQEDPEGELCYGKHDLMICQYEIYKAISAIERRKIFTHSGMLNNH